MLKATLFFVLEILTDCATDNYNTYITQYLKKKGNQTMKFGQLIKTI